MAHTSSRRVSAVLALAVTALALSACGDDDAAASTGRSTKEFCGEIATAAGGDDGPYQSFFDRHPDPVLADWAADGGMVTDAIDQMIEPIGAVVPSADAAPLMDEVIAAMQVMRQNSVDAQAVAAAGDQAAFDELERVNQDVNVPALMASFDAVKALCATVVTSGS